jgi:imidazolonepropionase-like amidohydrolase
MPLEQIHAIIDVAHARGLRASAHISRSHHLALAIESGVDDVADMVVDDLPEDLLDRMFRRNMAWVPTLELWSGAIRLYGLDWDRRAVENLGRYVAAGGWVATGTDYAGHGCPFDLGVPVTEMRLMHTAGMTPMQIIVASTRDAARVCGLPGHGVLAAGKAADVLVVDGNPLDNLEALRRT